MARKASDRPKRGQKHNRKNNEMERLQRRKEVAELYVVGCTQIEIADSLGIAPNTVTEDLRAVREEWLSQMVEDYDEAKAVELAKIDKVELNAWQQFERSCQDKVTLVTKRELLREIEWAEDDGADGKTRRKKKVSNELVLVKQVENETRTGQAGDPRFLQLIIECVEKRCKIRGLIKEGAQVNVQGENFTINWAQMYERQTVEQMNEADPIEQRISAVGKETK